MADMLPPDGVPWPPEPPEPADHGGDDAFVHIGAAPSAGRRLDDIVDWRTMPVSDAPSGYRGSVAAPPLPGRRVNRWSIAGAAMVLTFPAMLLFPLLVLVAVPLAVAFGLAGHREAKVAPELHRMAWLGAAAIAAAAVTAAVMAVLVARGLSLV
jgi:hypothetical protein